ncbi:MAG: hypothetical protein H8D78_00710 [Chloroflexi bacterium]|nr:hypothetical protein [Chloroflexota bacterium]MBL7065130.1 hypothetical protein [Anaerolineae bacterium]
MTNGERQELVAAVREALVPFKDELKSELKTEIQAELLEPMETRLRDEMGEMETRLRDDLRGEMGKMETRLRSDFGSRLDNLETEVRSITNDVVGPFINTVDAQHRVLVKRFDRLDRRFEHILSQFNLQERRLMRISDDVVATRQRLNILERQLSGEIIYGYDVSEAELMVAEERSVYETIRDLEKRVAHLEAHSEEVKGEIE